MYWSWLVGTEMAKVMPLPLTFETVSAEIYCLQKWWTFQVGSFCNYWGYITNECLFPKNMYMFIHISYLVISFMWLSWLFWLVSCVMWLHWLVERSHGKDIEYNIKITVIIKAGKNRMNLLLNTILLVQLDKCILSSE